jgi:hypothetical protein
MAKNIDKWQFGDFQTPPELSLEAMRLCKKLDYNFKSITETYKDYNIMSALVLREFLYQI